jgi:protein TonB
VTAAAGTVGAGAGVGRLGAWLVVSTLIHALAVATALRLAAHPAPSLVLIPVALLGPPGGGGGGGGSRGATSPPEAAVTPPAEAPVAARQTAPAHHRPRPHPAPTRLAAVPPPTAVAPAGLAGGANGAGTGGGGGGSGGGQGTGVGGGEGSGVARVAYGENPPPPYPLIARRLGMEGLVLLEVVVAPDGRAEDVRVLHSSGHPPLDESAVATVRSRWRFVPARRGGTPIESRVTVPIRFRLSDAG